ncbi:hypothetical protein IMSHALPRED_005296 [Imshaugia aleurites]|uniref:DUF7730 domain-containing protein n=1 Tax=Imshaugia aleurites TaxID=172621 RepID=A0A8H3IIB9_9LECA|nr:hypothetical protein IMSHALPRED_005296 [Imshaugia aleurites]
MPRTKKSATVQEVQEPFPVLRLPPEIRNSIWRYAVVKEGDVIVEKHRCRSLGLRIPASRLRSGCELRLHREDDQRRLASTLAVAFTCRQVYLEVTLIYYCENTFYLPDRHETTTEFVRAIGSEKAASILSIRLGNTNPDCYHLDKKLAYFPCLKRLELLKNPYMMYPYNRSCCLVCISAVISYVQKHPTTVSICEGEVWGLQEWIYEAGRMRKLRELYEANAS